MGWKFEFQRLVLESCPKVDHVDAQDESLEKRGRSKRSCGFYLISTDVDLDEVCEIDGKSHY